MGALTIVRRSTVVDRTPHQGRALKTQSDDHTEEMVQDLMTIIHCFSSRLHARIACQRADALHKLTTSLVQRFGRIVVEDLHIKGMVRNHRLARAISDMGFGSFRLNLHNYPGLQGK